MYGGVNGPVHGAEGGEGHSFTHDERALPVDPPASRGVGPEAAPCGSTPRRPLDPRFTTDVAMRHLIESLAAMGHDTDVSDDRLAAFIVGIQFARDHFTADQPDIGRVYEALMDLTAAVRADTRRPRDA